MCKPNCNHTAFCEFYKSEYECDINNDKFEDLCDGCKWFKTKDEFDLYDRLHQTPAHL